MTRYSLPLRGEVVSIFACLGLAWLLPHRPLDLFTVAPFAVAVFILSLFEVWLPRGDAADMSIAIGVGAVLRFGALTALIAIACASILAHVVERKHDSMTLLSVLVRRSLAVLVGSAVLAVLDGRFFEVRDSSILSLAQYGLMLLVAVAVVATEFMVAQAQTTWGKRQQLLPLLRSSLKYQGWLLAAQISAGVLAFLLFRTMRSWGLLLLVVLLLVMRQSFVLLTDIRQAYDSTMQVLTRTMEAESPQRLGHAQRVSELAIAVARELSIQAEYHSSG